MGSEQELARITPGAASDAPGDDMHVNLVDARQTQSTSGRHQYNDAPSVLREALVSRCGHASNFDRTLKLKLISTRWLRSSARVFNGIRRYTQS